MIRDGEDKRFAIFHRGLVHDGPTLQPDATPSSQLPSSPTSSTLSKGILSGQKPPTKYQQHIRSLRFLGYGSVPCSVSTLICTVEAGFPYQASSLDRHHTGT
ncbi:hypothetical protein J1614_000770 [Plenodomus biglobosus]|nr:hypothetical protein J1614_000770 [Plenodomus biglobosus]